LNNDILSSQRKENVVILLKDLKMDFKRALKEITAILKTKPTKNNTSMLNNIYESVKDFL